jgi:hypothetical protein
MDKLKQNQNDYHALILIILLYSFLGLIGIGCPIKYLTGISCLGCGMTRAVISALKCDFAKAMEYHPLFWIPIPIFSVWCLYPKIPKNVYRVCLYTVILLFIIVYIYRLLFSKSDIVSVNPCNGFIYKLITSVLRRD